MQELKSNINLLKRAKESKDVRLAARVARSLGLLRKKIVLEKLLEFIQQTYLANHPSRSLLIGFLESLPTEEATMVDDSNEGEGENNTEMVGGPENEAIVDSGEKDGSQEDTEDVSEEVDVLVQLVVLVLLLDRSAWDAAVSLSTSLVESITKNSRRTLSPLACKAFFYYSRSFEMAGRFKDARNTLMAAHRTSGLQHDEELEATILNCLLRLHLHYNQYEQAQKLLENTRCNEANVSSNQYARFLLYQARILCVQASYAEAGELLTQALRRSPQNGALGFRVVAQKYAIVAALLLGRIPAKTLFGDAELRLPLRPYFPLVQAVRDGNLAAFQEAVSKHRRTYERDKTNVLVGRLRTSVIKAGLRRINLAYSRISLDDVRAKLVLDSDESVEFIVAKAIRDGVIDASINHAEGFLQCSEAVDVYTSTQPAETFHKKIQLCFNLHNDCVKAMRFSAEVLQATNRRSRFDDDSDDDDSRPKELTEEEIAEALDEEDDE